MNCLRLSGAITSRDALRFTPAGLEAVNFDLSHTSELEEGGSMRQVECVLACVAFGPLARRIEQMPLNVLSRFEGFVAGRQRALRQIQFHITTLIED